MSEEKEKHRQATITEKVAEKISACGEHVESSVIDALVEVEVLRRTKIITEAVGFIGNFEKAYKKLDQPDGKVHVGIERTPQVTFSDNRIKEIAKAKETLQRLHAAFNKALNNNKAEDYDELQKLLKPSAGGGEKGPTAE